jgi:hypothetical protein
MFTVGDVVKKLRERKSWTKVDKTTIVRLENEGNSKQSTVEAVARALNMSVAALYAPVDVTSPVTPVVDAQEQELLDHFRRMSPTQRRMFVGMAETLDTGSTEPPADQGRSDDPTDVADARRRLERRRDR